jgi:hypothetical protein
MVLTTAAGNLAAALTNGDLSTVECRTTAPELEARIANLQIHVHERI